MAQYTFRLQGWQAVAALVVLGGVTGVEMYSRVRPVNDAMREAVRSELLAEYSGRGPKDVARFVAESRAGEPVEPVPALVQRDVEFTSMAARGTTGGAIVVRTEVHRGRGSPTGRPPGSILLGVAKVWDRKLAGDEREQRVSVLDGVDARLEQRFQVVELRLFRIRSPRHSPHLNKTN